MYTETKDWVPGRRALVGSAAGPVIGVPDAPALSSLGAMVANLRNSGFDVEGLSEGLRLGTSAVVADITASSAVTARSLLAPLTATQVVGTKIDASFARLFDDPMVSRTA